MQRGRRRSLLRRGLSLSLGGPPCARRYGRNACPPASPQVRHLVVAGGVAANTYVRGRLSAVADDAGLCMVCPPPRLCTDNGVMVAWAGVERRVPEPRWVPAVLCCSSSS